MLNEAVDALECKDGKIYVDCTLGGGGHSELILKRISPNGKLIAFDIDDEAITHSKERLKKIDDEIGGLEKQSIEELYEKYQKVIIRIIHA